MKFIRKIFFNRIIILATAFLSQLMFLISMLWLLSDYSQLFYGINLLISTLAILKIVYDDTNPAYKLAWALPIALMPIFGGVFYITFSGNQLSRKEKEKMGVIENKTKSLLEVDPSHLEAARDIDPYGSQQMNYLETYGPYPSYVNTDTTYYPIGEKNYEDMIIELKKAKKFIFMEYFIVERGYMWDSILEILKEKVKEGVDVRVVYDDLGCSLKLPHKYYKKIRSYGIKCEVFNPLVPIISSKYNTRDHRKILVIDGLVAFTGGLNIADEYINKIERLGHWKDMGIKLRGDAVWSFTVMFLTLWDYLSGDDTDITQFKVKQDTITEKGFVLPYSDNPLDNESVGENVYINMINKAKDYVYITTPYLIISSEMITALCNASKSGVDVRIITPHIPDKWYVHMVSQSYYEVLLKNGVKIFEYEPGFMHGKNFVVDDMYAVVGTINMDFRSLYLHFECGVWMMNTKTVLDVKEDYIDTLDKSVEITMEDLQNVGWFKILCALVLRLFAPLM
ncbi:cardiolipin synthase [Acidaminobacter sp. JC074]|uniref:cardiolipin synthase n=1 Tax=Acidaminobacter sp. JC074 TaxID=2530199 RepID=UPI001F101663|nr:cardiolipin synthase [Acidaminobacter sp. JC074]MCH4889828.1 cardiolipin synthase [Acidaminobacter sp. JC074]